MGHPPGRSFNSSRTCKSEQQHSLLLFLSLVLQLLSLLLQLQFSRLQRQQLSPWQLVLLLEQLLLVFRLLQQQGKLLLRFRYCEMLLSLCSSLLVAAVASDSVGYYTAAQHRLGEV